MNWFTPDNKYFTKNKSKNYFLTITYLIKYDETKW